MGPRTRAALALVALLIFTAWIFWPVSSFAWINYFDDRDFITGNAGITSGLTSTSLRYIVSDQAYYATGGPVTWLSHLVDIELYGLAPAGHHVTSLLIHLANVVLLFALMTRLTGAWIESLIVSAIFAVHPLHVESVAWVSARKDLVSTAFWLAALMQYQKFVSQRSRRAFALALLCCMAGLLSKPIVAMLPLTMLLLDVWPLARIDRARPLRRQLMLLLGEKIPFALLGAGALALVFQSQVARGAIAAVEPAPLLLRVSNAIVSYAEYLWKAAWPSDLSAFYPYRWDIPTITVALAATVLIVITAAALLRLRQQPFVFTGWAWYLGTLLPVSGIVRIGGHAMADRLTYVPLIGVAVAVTWLVSGAIRRRPRLVGPAVATAVIAIIGLGVVARAQVRTWKDDETLWRHALAVNAENGRAHANLAALLTEQGRVREALTHFTDALRLEPDEPKVRNNYALALIREGDRSGAMAELREAVRLDPGYGRAHANLADQLAALGLYEDAFRHYDQAIATDPRSGLARMNKAVTLAEVGRLDEAASLATTAVSIEPKQAEWRFTTAMMLKLLGRRAEAIRELEEVLRQRPEHAGARRELAALR